MSAQLCPALRDAWSGPSALRWRCSACAGGCFGAHFGRRVNQCVMRWTVTAIGFVTAGYFFLLNALVHP